MTNEVCSPRRKAINILGIRGIPAAHGGFETFADRLSRYLRDRGWAVNVYCQLEPDAEGRLAENYEDEWEGIHRTYIGSGRRSSLGSVIFDWLCVRDVLKRPGIDLTLGYNTAVFSLLQRLRGRKVVLNMDGIEWRRAKWSRPIKAWFYLNEFVGANICNIPIADHPEIARHLRRHGVKRAVVIPYGADAIEHASTRPVRALGLEPNGYFTSIARIEPENSILEIVRCFSRRPRGVKLAVLGKLEYENTYHRMVHTAASGEVVFPGSIYQQEAVAALRFHSLAYLHGHQVGGTNPSLVEALGAGNAIIAHENRFNKWVTGGSQFYFSEEMTLEQAFGAALARGEDLARARRAARARAAQFTWQRVLADYEHILESAIR